ncbi:MULTISPECIES: ATP-binding protein [unclassified Leptolyngbya]|uniref:ATP-binding protein n=1 Tax=unclassified Leptolyngbya TaxID=2650499 RepID=UPI0016854C0F|nr:MULTISPECIES: ATP-binding protein [unclassified Leptolyngbya]MBD1912263.1 ATP-binding protein [Leptolyngbya sp. FACHB-8]MBD2155154.1 ATP-binding protein [Leptolyngbya sp. FACHB-16]
MKVLQSQQLQVSTELVALNQVLSWFEDFDHTFIPEAVWLQCQLALAEGFTNVVRHAHKGKPSTTVIDLEVVILEDRLEIRIWDYGPQTNLNEVIDTLSQEMDREAEGGRGLKLMKKVADVLKYQRGDDQRNCLLIVKQYNAL